MDNFANEALSPVRAYWNTLAKEAPEGCEDHWVDDAGVPLAASLYDEVAAYIAEQLPKEIDFNPAILEIGCGTGRILGALQKILPNANLWGIDVAEEQIKNAMRHLNRINLQSKDLDAFITSNDREFLGKFDVIYLHGVTQYFPSTEYFQHTLENATRLLKAGGVLCLMDVPVDWYYEQMRGRQKNTLLTPLKTLIKRLINYKPKVRKGAISAIEVLNGKSIEIPVFQGYWANPEMIERFCRKNYSEFLMTYHYCPVDFKGGSIA